MIIYHLFIYFSFFYFFFLLILRIFPCLSSFSSFFLSSFSPLAVRYTLGGEQKVFNIVGFGGVHVCYFFFLDNI